MDLLPQSACSLALEEFFVHITLVDDGGDHLLLASLSCHQLLLPGQRRRQLLLPALGVSCLGQLLVLVGELRSQPVALGQKLVVPLRQLWNVAAAAAAAAAARAKSAVLIAPGELELPDLLVQVAGRRLEDTVLLLQPACVCVCVCVMGNTAQAEVHFG